MKICDRCKKAIKDNSSYIVTGAISAPDYKTLGHDVEGKKSWVYLDFCSACYDEFQIVLEKTVGVYFQR